ncbi:hypothetical protein [Breoghania sp.]|uniref:hypothetical protein n=1 Tax=Breoghania sp. TaxID=2065378 RepID=UPI002607F007|nr:hypothetical protein [Breoghania sp.]MDJ0933706.1 hypothetical protein [Breoghania sp.]
MVKKVKLYKNNKYIYVPISEWFEKHYKELPYESRRDFEIISKIFEINTLDDYKEIYDYLWIDFNYHRILIKYEELKKMNLPFDGDIIKFIAFLFGTRYFGHIGHTTFEKWLKAKDIHHPNKKIENENEGFSLLDAVKYKYGQNAIRSRLLSTLKRLQ